MNRSLCWSGFAVVAAMLGTAGCTVSADPPPVYATAGVQASYVDPGPAQVSVEPASDVYVDPGPVVYVDAPLQIDIGAYPRADFGGRPVYFYQDHWYYRDGGRWAYYQHEPPALYRQRRYVAAAPAARVERSRGVVERAPAARAPVGHFERPAPARRAPAARPANRGHR